MAGIPAPEYSTLTPEAYVLLERIESYEFDEPGCARPIAQRLAQENGWSARQAANAIREYRRFMFLVCTAGHSCCPSDEVDQVWHLHLTYTRSYWRKFCQEVLGRPVHHEPSRGGAAERQKHVAMYLATLKSYEEAFGERPPRATWPPTTERFDPRRRHQRVDRSTLWLLPRIPWPRWMWAAAASAPAIVLAAAGAPKWLEDLNPLDLPGPQFLMLYGGTAAFILVFAAVAQYALKRRDTQPPAADYEPSTYDIAYLTGDAKRVLTTGILQLLQWGSLQSPMAGAPLVREINADLPAEAHPVEQTIFQFAMEPECADRVKPDVQRKRIHLGLAPYIAEIQERLHELGLVVDRGSQALYRWMVVGPWTLLMALGVVKLAVGIARGRPVGFLIAALVVSVIVLIVLWKTPPRLTPAGKRLVNELKRRHQELKSIGKTTAGSVLLNPAFPLAVGLFGVAEFAALNDPSLAALIRHPGIADSGSGCGGSGCGGGGGGGCGGGCGGCGD